MENLIQYCTKASLYDGEFGGKTGWPAAGMGYLIQTNGGKLIAIDGGAAEDAESFIELIEQTGKGSAEVDLWIITHPHGDHYYALLEIAKNPALASRVHIKRVLYHFPEEFVANNKVGTDVAEGNANMDLICRTFGAEAYLPKVDEHLTVDSVDLHFLYTPTDCSILNNPNQLSLIFTVQGAKKKVLFTGDAFPRNLYIALWRYGNGLQCDILQMPHHGLCDTGVAEFYQKANAQTLLIPISKAGSAAMEREQTGTKALLNRQIAADADSVYRAFEGTVTLEL